MKRFTIIFSLAFALLTLVSAGGCHQAETPSDPDQGGSTMEKVEKWSIHDGKFWQDGKWDYWLQQIQN